MLISDIMLNCNTIEEEIYNDDLIEEARKEYEIEEEYEFMYSNSIKY